MAFDLTQRAFDQLRTELDRDIDKGVTVKPEDLFVTQKHIDDLRNGKGELTGSEVPRGKKKV